MSTTGRRSRPTTTRTICAMKSACLPPATILPKLTHTGFAGAMRSKNSLSVSGRPALLSPAGLLLPACTVTPAVLPAPADALVNTCSLALAPPRTADASPTAASRYQNPVTNTSLLKSGATGNRTGDIADKTGKRYLRARGWLSTQNAENVQCTTHVRSNIHTAKTAASNSSYIDSSFRSGFASILSTCVGKRMGVLHTTVHSHMHVRLCATCQTFG